MHTKRNKYLILLFVLIFSILNITNENNLNIKIILYISILIQSLKYQNNLRRLWSEKVNFRERRDNEPKDSITHCKNTDYKYKIFYSVGQEYTYQKESRINNKIDGVSKYLL